VVEDATGLDAVLQGIVEHRILSRRARRPP
jgi:hypothetical protein